MPLLPSLLASISAVPNTDAWQTLLNVGGIAGILSLLWQAWRELSAFSRRPFLKILKFDPEENVLNINMHGKDRRYVVLHVKNLGRRVASHCVAHAKATYLSSSKERIETELHWARHQVEYITTGARSIDILPNDTERLDVAFSQQGDTSAWLAAESALHGHGMGRAVLLPGKHSIKVIVTFHDGNAATAVLRLKSSSAWGDLTAVQARRSLFARLAG
jgi:hypothetical protein